jgi:serine phosphatase RsbU (regulator of sigma subunit)
MTALLHEHRLRSVQQTGLGPASDDALDRFAELVQLLLDVPVALVSLVDARRQFFPGQVGLPLPWSDARQTPLSHSFCQHVVDIGAELVVTDAREHPLLASNLAIQDLAVIGYAGMPLTDQSGNVLGSLCAISPVPRDWTQREIDVLRHLAAACSAELQLRIVVRSHRVAVERLALLAEVTRSVGNTLEAQEIIDRVVRLLVPGMADWATAGLLSDTGAVRLWTGRVADGVVAPFTGAQTSLAPESPVRIALATQEAQLISRPTMSMMLAAPGQDEVFASSVMLVPLLHRGAALGYLALGRSLERLEPFLESDLHDASDIGRRVAMSLTNAQLFDRERSTSESLQRHMLTSLPHTEQLQLCARYQPALDTAKVGGDWYDAFVQPDGSTIVVVGDVTGHDIDAAAMMGQVRNLLRATAFGRGDHPAAVLSRLDRLLEGLRVDSLATVLVARVEPMADGQALVRWSNAGHPPPVLALADGTATVLRTDGELLLGLDPLTLRTNHEVVLAAGAVLLLYTDGLVERRDQDLDDGLDRLQGVLGPLSGAPIDELCDKVLLRMLPHGAEDDVALVAVRLS